jgi:hypothetical protein
VRRRIIGVPDCDNTSVDVGGKGVYGVEDRFRYAAGFVDDHQYVARVDALESSWVIVGRLASIGDELVTDIPLGIQRDAPRQSSLPVGVAHVAPKDRLDLRRRRSSCNHESLARWVHVDPTKERASTSCGTSKHRAMP